jgi:oxalate---CoA ligase
VLHKYFYNQSETWQGILERTETTDNPFPDDLEPMDDQDGQFSSTFSSIDARHLTSLQLIQSRVTKLLESAENKTYPLNQSLSAIVGDQTTYLFIDTDCYGRDFKTQTKRKFVFIALD